MSETNDYQLIWNEVMDQIRADLGEAEFEMWFNLEFQKASGEEFTVLVPSLFYQSEVQRRYQDYIEGKIEELIGKRVNLMVKPKNDTPRPPEDQNTSAAIVPAAPPKGSHPQLKENYNFDTYVVAENNSFAANAAKAVARNPGTAYNPLFIYGGVGLGKTHLMQAIGNYVHANTDLKVIYVSAETFTNEFIASIHAGGTKAFKKRYREDADVLLIDDIHFLEKKVGTQEELFYTFNELYDDNKQIAFTCDRPHTELKGFEDRLQNRIGHGLNVDLQPPNEETRRAILKKKADASHIVIPDEVIELISKNISTNVRDLESALTKLIAYAELVDKSLSLKIAQQQLKDVFASPKQSNLSIEIIQRVIAEEFHLSSSDLKGKKQNRNIVYPRQLAMFITREITEQTTTEIGQAFGGRDHTTVMHSCQKIESLIRSDPSVDSTVQNLIRTIKEYNAKL